MLKQRARVWESPIGEKVRRNLAGAHKIASRNGGWNVGDLSRAPVAWKTKSTLLIGGSDARITACILARFTDAGTSEPGGPRQASSLWLMRWHCGGKHVPWTEHQILSAPA